MQPTWQTADGSVKLWCADCLQVLPTLEAGSVDAVVTDPQYGLADRDSMPTMAHFELAYTNLDRPSAAFYHRRNGWERQHPTEKPLPLMVWCVEMLTPCIRVLDPFMGSGTTGVACVRTGRKFLGIEKEPKYFEIAVKRIEAELNRAPLFDEPPAVVQGNFLEAP